ncbi:methylated-DNA--protein-cysteine methyltransferase, constitutive [Clostridium oryzae]|uniref:Methylated-DNA--protein-cysteine methyltransferase n=1 Tax=Clostridium oryzae TaxID=1450648 RepID=A0A1V4IPU4_9CLOT|nr:methylated-DNA--protein-cysteine methyltransferase, constitutive [Clostridium oryzae]
MFWEKNIRDCNFQESDLIKAAYEQLQQYFEGRRKIFDLPLTPQGTEFQLKVWKALQQIPYGTTCSYKDIAEKVGNIKACRAIGMANNRNPIPIFIPCHRVIGADGKLVGYGGGLHIKKRLLEIENVKLKVK